MNTTWQILLTSGCGVAFIKLFEGIMQWYLQRRAHKEDTEEQSQAESDAERLAWRAKTDESIDALKEGLKFLLLDSMKRAAAQYIQNGAITYDEKRLLHKQHIVYHDGLNGNGDFNALMEEVDDLPLKI